MEAISGFGRVSLRGLEVLDNELGKLNGRTRPNISGLLDRHPLADRTLSATGYAREHAFAQSSSVIVAERRSKAQPDPANQQQLRAGSAEYVDSVTHDR